jgi:L-arabinonolactonase
MRCGRRSLVGPPPSAEVEIREAVRAQNTLGEGPLWDVERNGLWWLDLKRHSIGFWELDSPSHRLWPAPGPLGSAALRRDGRLLVAGSALWNFDPSKSTPFTEVASLPSPEPSTNRFNDGRVDAQGRFVVGTMDDAERDRTGSLYRIAESTDSTLAVEQLWDACGIPNGACFSPDGSVGYWADSWDPVLCRYDPADPSATRTPFAPVGVEGGADGACVDADGHVWLAHWDGWKLSRFRPDGSLERTLPLPVQRPTCPTFGGPNFATLFVTTASHGLADEQRRAQPLAGSILALPLGNEFGIVGLPEHRFGHENN